MSHPHGEARLGHKLTNTQVLEIFSSSEKTDWLALVYHVSTTTIYHIRSQKSWRHLTDGLSNTNTRPRTTTVLPFHKHASFVRWANGERTTETFEEMCRDHDLTYMFSDDLSISQNGWQAFRIISEAGTVLGMDVATPIWNKVVNERLQPFYAVNFLWKTPPEREIG